MPPKYEASAYGLQVMVCLQCYGEDGGEMWSGGGG